MALYNALVITCQIIKPHLNVGMFRITSNRLIITKFRVLENKILFFRDIG